MDKGKGVLDFKGGVDTNLLLISLTLSWFSSPLPNKGSIVDTTACDLRLGAWYCHSKTLTRNTGKARRDLPLLKGSSRGGSLHLVGKILAQ